MANPIIVVERATHRTFPFILDMLAFDAMAVAAVGAARKLQLPFDYAATEFTCNACGFTLRANLDGLLTAIDTGSFPDVIQFEVLSSFAPAMSRPIGGIKAIDERMKCSTFAVFIDRVMDWLKPQHSNFHSWPPLANFSRVVRNAIIHGGTINITSENAATVEWLGVSFGHANLGEPVFSDRFSVGDLVPLMLKLEEELNWLGAPFDL